MPSKTTATIRTTKEAAKRENEEKKKRNPMRHDHHKKKLDLTYVGPLTTGRLMLHKLRGKIHPSRALQNGGAWEKGGNKLVRR